MIGRTAPGRVFTLCPALIANESSIMTMAISRVHDNGMMSHVAPNMTFAAQSAEEDLI